MPTKYAKAPKWKGKDLILTVGRGDMRIADGGAYADPRLAKYVGMGFLVEVKEQPAAAPAAPATPAEPEKLAPPKTVDAVTKSGKKAQQGPKDGPKDKKAGGGRGRGRARAQEAEAAAVAATEEGAVATAPDAKAALEDAVTQTDGDPADPSAQPPTGSEGQPSAGDGGSSGSGPEGNEDEGEDDGDPDAE